MALKRQTFVKPAETLYVAPPNDPRTAAEIEAAARVAAERMGVDPNLPPRERAQAMRKRLVLKGMSEPVNRRAWAWDLLREFREGKRSPLDAVKAAEALGLTPKEALRRSAEGWGPHGPPARREPGQDDEEVAA